MRAESIAVAPPPVAVPAESGRQLPFDWLRGLVMVLMTVDHASGEFNAGRLFTDATFLYTPGMPLPVDQFLTRWITHLCAPVFVFLAGYVMQLSVRRRLEQGESEGSITRFIVTRGLIIAALDPLWMRLVFKPPGGLIVLQVLYAIGMSFVVMAFLRRIPPFTIGILGVVLAFVSEPLRALVPATGSLHALGTLLVAAGPLPPFIVGYPLIPWLAIMMMGWGAAELGRREPSRFPARVALAGLVALALFFLFRGLNGWGNMGLFRENGSLVQWLHVSKYPPSVAYDALELGIGWLLLALFLVWRPPAWADAVLRPLGQSAFFFYLLHAHLLAVASYGLGMHNSAGLVATYVSSAAVIAVLVPACKAYRRYKLAHPRSLAQYI
ncbi:MAG TPA: heparan-alpha-glucosaminide N-acetyltransferase domain-containing protein [Myxococcaceae bacterium]|nr:heparan-alpha-glucosaminide N-acetyltransferase domain-containing protein [Myxococcaceae bacterium]